MATTTRSNKELIEQTCDAINDKDEQAFRELQAPDIVQRDGREVLHGVDAVTDRLWSLLTAFPDLTLTPETMFADADMVAMWYTATGTHQGEFMGIEPTGEDLELSELKMYLVKEGKVVEVWGVSDRLGILTQLGIIDLPGGQ